MILAGQTFKYPISSTASGQTTERCGSPSRHCRVSFRSMANCPLRQQRVAQQLSDPMADDASRRSISPCKSWVIKWGMQTYFARTYFHMQTVYIHSISNDICMFVCMFGLGFRHYNRLNDFSSPKGENLKIKSNKILLRVESFKI